MTESPVKDENDREENPKDVAVEEHGTLASALGGEQTTGVRQVDHKRNRPEFPSKTPDCRNPDKTYLPVMLISKSIDSGLFVRDRKRDWLFIKLRRPYSFGRASNGIDPLVQF